jgi:cyclophilin family peptidyl-prolyl cis-trans isomerase
MVGWAGGGGGPDFFINTHKEPVDWWEHQHTVWGQVKDEQSLELIERIYKLPAQGQGMRMLNEQIEFSVELF